MGWTGNRGSGRSGDSAGNGGSAQLLGGTGTGSLGAHHCLGVHSARLTARALPERWAELQGVGGKSKGFPQELWGTWWGPGHANRTRVGPCSLLTFCLAHVVCLHEVLGAAADMGALGVVAELGAGPKAQALVDVWAAGDEIRGRPGGCPDRPQFCPKDTIPAPPAPPQL